MAGRTSSPFGGLADMNKITAEEVKRRMDSGEPLAFVDVRSPKAWDSSDAKLPSAVRRRGGAIPRRRRSL
jgi:hypothetical protein